MNKHFKTLFLSLAIFFMVSCHSSSPTTIHYNEEPSLVLTVDESWPSEPLNETTTLDFYSLNDFHGSIEYNPNNGEIGLTRLATYLKKKQEINPNATFLASGDMWQGSADSNLTQGRLMVDAMNLLGFEAMALGNHEFDWSDEVILANQSRADFPFLGANIMDKRTERRSDLALPYTLIHKEGVKIGVIGTIGSDLENSILASAVQNYDFIPAGVIVKKASTYLRQLGAKVVILLNHNPEIENSVLPYVDAVFNGHSHTYEKKIREGVPLLQAQSNGQAVAHVQFEYIKSRDELNLKTYDVDTGLLNQSLEEDLDMYNLYETYLENEISAIKNRPIGSAVTSFNKVQLGNLAVRSMYEDARENYSVVASFHNGGGVRDVIYQGEVTYGDIYKVFPFDNYMTIIELTGSQLKWWLSQSDNYVYGADPFTKTLKDGSIIKDKNKYKIATINYLSEKTYASVTSYPHNLNNEIYLNRFVRDTIADYWVKNGTLNPGDYR